MRKIASLIICLFLVGCGGSDDVNFVNTSNNINPTTNNSTVTVNSGSGQFLIDDGFIHAELDGVAARLVNGDGTQTTLREFVQQAGISHDSPREATLTYQLGGQQQTAQIQIVRALASDEDSLAFSGKLTDQGGNVLAQQVDDTTVFEDAQLVVGRPLELSISSGTLEVSSLQGYNIRVQSYDDDSFDQTAVGFGQFKVPVGIGGSDYIVTVSASGLADCSTLAAMSDGETQRVTIIDLGYPGGVNTGFTTVHVGFDDLFNTDANNNLVMIHDENGVLEYSNLTNSDGIVQFRGFNANKEYYVTANDDYGNTSEPVTIYAGQTVDITVKGHF